MVPTSDDRLTILKPATEERGDTWAEVGEGRLMTGVTSLLKTGEGRSGPSPRKRFFGREMAFTRFTVGVDCCRGPRDRTPDRRHS